MRLCRELLPDCTSAQTGGCATTPGCFPKSRRTTLRSLVGRAARTDIEAKNAEGEPQQERRPGRRERHRDHRADTLRCEWGTRIVGHVHEDKRQAREHEPTQPREREERAGYDAALRESHRDVLGRGFALGRRRFGAWVRALAPSFRVSARVKGSRRNALLASFAIALDVFSSLVRFPMVTTPGMGIGSRMVGLEPAMGVQEAQGTGAPVVKTDGDRRSSIRTYRLLERLS